MGYLEENNSEIYKNLTKPDNTKINQKWTKYLALCCLTVCIGSFQFGYNVGSFNLASPILLDYYDKTYFAEIFHEKVDLYKEGVKNLTSGIERYNDRLAFFINKTEELDTKKKKYAEGVMKREMYLDRLFSLDPEDIEKARAEKKASEEKIRAEFNMTVEEFFEYALKKLEQGTRDWEIGKQMLLDGNEKIANGTKRLKEANEKIKAGRVKLNFVVLGILGLTISLFILGGLVGALTSKCVMDKLGRKNGIIFHYLFAILGAVCVFLPPHLGASKLGPVLIKIGRFFQGVQGGMACSIIPTYLSEIAPSSLRGQTGVIHNIFITSGILFSQILGIESFLGNENWNFLAAMPFIPAVIGAFLLLIFFDDTPKFLLFELSNEGAAIRALRKLRNTDEVSTELTKMYVESSEIGVQGTMGIIKVLMSREQRSLILTSIVLQFAQQFSGVYAILFYSYFIVKNLGFGLRLIECCVIITGLSYVISTIFCGFIVDRVGRKPLLLSSMAVMIVNHVLFIAFMLLGKGTICAVVAIACLVIVILSYAFGLGPIPLIFVAESFPDYSRSAAMSISVFSNYIFNFFITLAFPFLLHLIGGKVIGIFVLSLIFSALYITKMMPETKERRIEEMNNFFNLKETVA